MNDQILATPFTFTRDGLKLAAIRFEHPDRNTGVPVIISHGFLNTKENVARYARLFAAMGYTAYTFDFAGGAPKNESEGAFADMSVQTEKEDLFRLMDHACREAGDKASELILMGCSQGGFVSAMAAAERPGRVKKLILFYPALCIPDDARRGRMMFYTFDPANVPETVAGPAGKLPLGRRYVLDGQALNAFTAISGYRGDILFVHGTADRLVDIRYSEMAVNALRGREDGGDVRLVRVEGAGHGFRGEQDRFAMRSVRQFLLGRQEILTVDVRLIKPFREVKEGRKTTLTLPFRGYASGDCFEGVIQPGAQDVQVRENKKPVHFCADYIITGVDYTGAGCSVHVVNQTDDGVHWDPSVTTDSTALAFLNKARCYCVFESRRGGPLIHIYA